jgi:hypothetical protein
MTSFKIVGAVALSLLVAAPAVAAQVGHHHYRYAHRMLPIQHARDFRFGSVYNSYGLERGDEFAPGNAYQNDFERRNTFN